MRRSVPANSIQPARRKEHARPKSRKIELGLPHREATLLRLSTDVGDLLHVWRSTHRPRRPGRDRKWHSPSGLYAAGEIVGLFYHEYPAGRAVLRSLTFGRIAGAHAAKTALTNG